MCMCAKPNRNGQPGYSWDGKTIYTRPVNPPELGEGDELLHDEPGRCGGAGLSRGGGLDSHCHHFRIVRHYGSYFLLVRHGAGDERIPLGGCRPGVAVLSALDSEARYWALQLIHAVQGDRAREARDSERATWHKAAAEKRIRTRRLPKRGTVKVWIEDPAPTVAGG